MSIVKEINILDLENTFLEFTMEFKNNLQIDWTKEASLFLRSSGSLQVTNRKLVEIFMEHQRSLTDQFHPILDTTILIEDSLVSSLV